MAAIKVIAFLCLAVLATSTQIPKIQPPLKDIVTDALALLNKLTDVLTSAITAAIQTIDGLLDSVLSAAAQIETDLKATLAGIVSDLLQSIDDLEEEATKAGVDAAICIGSSVDDIKALPTNFLTNVTSCLSGKISAITDEINETIDDVQGTASALGEYGEEIVNCTTQGLFEVVCIGKVVAKMTASIVSLPIAISEDVVSITAAVASAIAGLAGCEVGVVAEFTAEGTGIVSDVKDCVENLINGTSIH